MSSYQPIELHKKKSDVLVIHCADPRFQNAYRSVVDKLGAYHDLIVAPGASKAVVEDEKLVENVKLLESLHHFEKVHIMDHIQCGAFGEIEDELKAHASMLSLAAKKIKAQLPHLDIVHHLLGEKGELPLEVQG